MNAFSHLSLLIDLDTEPWQPEPAAFTATDRYFPRRSRRLLHESLHYWQQLSQGYLLQLAEEDWTAFLAAETTGQVQPAGPRRTHFRQPEGRHGFSAWNVAESLTQFWEVFLTGRDVRPVAGAGADQTEGTAQWTSDQELDAAMLASSDYSEPFRLARRLVDREFSLIIFPFLAHFALKTARPAYFFERFLEELAGTAGQLAREAGVLEPASGPAPGVLYAPLETLCAELVRREGGTGLLHAPVLFAASPLREHPVYAWSFQRLAQVEARVQGGTPLDVVICLPTHGHRAILAQELTPPCLRFADRTPLALAHTYLQRDARTPPATLDAARDAAVAALAIQAREEERLTATRGY